MRLGLLLLLCTLLLVGCGPEEGASNDDLTAETIRIAQDYEQSGNLGDARAQLDALEAANPTQFLIFLAEDRTSSEPDSPETASLVHLSLALGLQSGKLMDYAMQHGLLANVAAPTLEPIGGSVVQSIEPVTSAEQSPAAAPPTVAVVALVPTEEAPDTSSPETSSETSTEALDETAAVTTSEAPPATPISKPQIQASQSLNVRSGPGTDYPLVGAITSGQQADITAKNPESDWWEITLPSGQTGWVYAPLVQTSGDTSTIAIATNIPAAPPTPTPAPVAVAPTQAPAPEQPPAEQAPAEQPVEPPAEAAPEQPAPVVDGNDFVMIERRLWDVVETGGQLSGDSVICGEKRELHVNVVDANGSRLNGVAVQAIYGAQEIFVTGAQGKGDGKVEFVLGSGQGVRVIRDADGREVSSDSAEGLTTHSPEIPHDILIGAQYCTDKESCDRFNFSAGCWGHHSWTVTFQRKY